MAYGILQFLDDLVELAHQPELNMHGMFDAFLALVQSPLCPSPITSRGRDRAAHIRSREVRYNVRWENEAPGVVWDAVDKEGAALFRLLRSGAHSDVVEDMARRMLTRAIDHWHYEELRAGGYHKVTVVENGKPVRRWQRTAPFDPLNMLADVPPVRADPGQWSSDLFTLDDVSGPSDAWDARPPEEVVLDEEALSELWLAVQDCRSHMPPEYATIWDLLTSPGDNKAVLDLVGMSRATGYRRIQTVQSWMEGCVEGHGIKIHRHIREETGRG